MPDLEELVTLTEASRALKKGAAYFRVLRHRYPDTFPEPRRAWRGVDLFDQHELTRWDQLRRQNLLPTTNEETKA